MKIKNGFVIREICGEKVFSGEGAENINLTKIVRLNESAAFLLEKVGNGEFTAESLADMLVEHYGIERETALKDASALCKSLEANGIAE